MSQDIPQQGSTPPSLPWRLFFRLLLHLSAQLRELCQLQREAVWYLSQGTQLALTEETPRLEDLSLASWLREDSLPASPSEPTNQDPSHPDTVGLPSHPASVGQASTTPSTLPTATAKRKLDQTDVIQVTSTGVTNLGHRQQASSLRQAARDRSYQPIRNRQ